MKQKIEKQQKNQQNQIFGKIRKIDEPLDGTKKIEQITKREMKRGRGHCYQPYKIKRIIMKFYGQLYTNELDYINEVDKFMERHKLSKLTLEN